MKAYPIEGMTCQHCRQAVEQALQEVPGVSAVRVDLEQHTAHVAGDAAFELLRAAVEEEGFSLLSAAK